MTLDLFIDIFVYGRTPIMSDSEEEALLLLMLHRRRRKRRHMWVHPILQNRRRHGLYYRYDY